MKKRAVFLDRDGTINEDIGDLFNVKKLQFIPRAIDALKLLQERFLLFIITNQAGIGKGDFTEADFLKFNKEYLNILKKEGIKIEEVYYCPHAEYDDCICRKPKTYFVEIASRKYNLDLKESFIVGDHPSDVEMGSRTQMKSIFLLTGHGKKHLDDIKNKTEFLISENIYDAALLILKLTEKS
jgi:D-glycero-D-manno-heptose 1,7-bisphosphate phosphatase